MTPPGQDFSDQLAQVWSRSASLSRVALISPTGQTVTYQELLDEIGDLSEGPRITIILFAPSVAGVKAYLRCISQPGPTIILDYHSSVDVVREVIHRFQAEEIEGPISTISQLGFPISYVSGDWARASNSISTGDIEDSKSTVLLGTSGTTGNKKFVRLASSSLLANAADIVFGLDIEESDTAVTLLSPSYSYGLSIINSFLIAGGRILLSELSPLQKGCRELLEKWEVSHLPGVPSVYDIYDRTGFIEDPPRSVRTFTQAGGKLSKESVRRYALQLASKGIRFFPMYGQTEATARMAILDSNLAATYPDSVGMPVRSGAFSIGSSQYDDEIIYSGPNVMLGYASSFSTTFQNDELEGTLHTGDLGAISHGLLFIRGRSKRILKISGIRLDLDELEIVLSDICDCAITGDDSSILVMYVRAGQETVQHVSNKIVELGLKKSNLLMVEVPAIIYSASGKKNYPAMIKTYLT